MKSICFVSLDSYPLLNEDTNNQTIGGAEIQQVLLANYIKKEFNVSFITYANPKHGDWEYINGIKIIKTFEPKHHTGIIEKIKRFKISWKALKTANADIYYQRGADLLTGVIALFCKLYNKKFIHAIALDSDIMDKQNSLYTYGLKNANLVLAQTETQLKLLEDNFGIKGIKLNSAIELAPERNVKGSNSIKKILWVSNIKPSKNPLAVIEIAKQIPEAKFIIIGGNHDDVLHDRLLEAIETVDNVEYLGFIPYNKINEYFANADIFINTSLVEGFPNTFLQAWNNNVPVVSLNVNSDNILTDYSIGKHSITINQMIEDIKYLLSHDINRNTIGNNGKKYLSVFHDIKNIVQQFKDVINTL